MRNLLMAFTAVGCISSSVLAEQATVEISKKEYLELSRKAQGVKYSEKDIAWARKYWEEHQHLRSSNDKGNASPAVAAGSDEAALMELARKIMVMSKVYSDYDCFTHLDYSSCSRSVGDTCRYYSRYSCS